MKLPFRSICFTLLSTALPGLAVDIPESVPGPPGSGRDAGFLVRSVQAPAPPEGEFGLPPVLSRGIFQLNGTLKVGGAVVANEAKPGDNDDGTFSVATINFEQEALVEDVNGDPEEGGGPITNFNPNALFPGIPGTEGHTTNFTTEIVTFLELTAGEHTFGGQVWIDRTDAPGGVNDDNFAVYSGTNPSDFLATKLGEYVRSADAPQFAAIPDDYTFTFTAPSDGLYPFRLVYLQKTGGAGLEWYSVDSATGDKILINDPEDARAIKAFQSSTAIIHNHPYIAEIRPQPGSRGIPAGDKVEILLIDSEALIVANSVQIFVNGRDVTGDSTISNADGRTSIAYQPNPAREDLSNSVRVLYDDTAGRSFDRSWDFEISPGVGVTTVTGQWDFDNGDLVASTGRDLEFLRDSLVDTTEFGTTTELGVPDINGEPANVMYVPKPDGNGKDVGYVMYHGLVPNGGGTRVNQYTLLMDVMVHPDASGAGGIIQIDSPRPGANGVIPNSGDGDYFWQNGQVGQGQGGYHGFPEGEKIEAGEWYRLVFAVDLAADPPLVTKYANGIKLIDWEQNSIDQPRRALLEDYSILFADNGDENVGWYANSVQIREGKMSDVEIESLGGPTAEGFPLILFDDPNATVSTRNTFGDLGNDLSVQTRRIVVFNSGETKDLTISSVEPTGPEKDFYSVVSFPETLASAEEGVIVVEFDPQGQSGVFEAGIEILSNDGGEASIVLDVTARVTNPSGLVAHYQMDEASGTAMLDASGQRYHGTYGAAGTGSFALGAAGLATGSGVAFSDGGSPAGGGGGFGQLDASASIPSLQNLTISLWMQPDAADAGASMLVAKGTAAGDPFALATNAVGESNPLLWFVQEGQEIETDPVIMVGQPHHVVITQLDQNGLELGSTRTRLYVDGVLVNELEEGNGYEDVAPSVIQIGALNGGFGFTGIIDDVQIYSRELAEAEVQFLFANPGDTAGVSEPSDEPQDVTSPGDALVRVDGENDDDGNAGLPPGGEVVRHVIDDVAQKHLNFLDLNSGFIVTPSAGATVVNALRLYTANDNPARDPASYQLSGSTVGPDGPFEVISEGDLALPDDRNEDASAPITPGLFHQEVSFENATAYVSYRLIFPTLKDAGGDNSMQIAEVEFLGVPEARGALNPVAISTGPQTEPGLVNFGELSGDATYEFSFNANQGGASTAIAGNDVWGLKLDQWNMQGIFGTTEFGVVDNIFDGVASIFGEDVHVVFVSDAAAGETHLYINGELVGTSSGAVALSGEVNLMQAGIPGPVDPMGDGSVVYGWATYNSALSAEDIAGLVSSPFPMGGETGGGDPAPLGTVTFSADGNFSFDVPDGATYDIEFSEDLIMWEVIAAEQTGPFEEFDAARAGLGAGFYRGVQK